MNREIKFRAWDGEKMRFTEGAKIFEMFTDSKKDVMVLLQKHYKLMQFTGLKDKNGVEIYEGDVVSYHADAPRRRVYIVVKWDFWNKGVAGLFIGDLECEVIGNIHENPELLEQSNA